MGRKSLYTVEDASETLSIGRTRIYELIACGQLQAVKIGRSTRITHEAIEDFIAKLESITFPIREVR